MCGRFGQFTPVEELARQFELDETVPLTPRYNISPTQPAALVRVEPETGRRRLDLLRWGLIPSWSRELPKTVFINARSDTVFDKPAFRSAVKKRRGLIPADGFYEWKKEGRKKQPYFIRLTQGRLMALAGLWERWDGPEGPVESCTILTTEANDLMGAIHQRMPVIIPPGLHRKWLDPGIDQPRDIRPMLMPLPGKEMMLTAVNEYVNKGSHEGPECIRPLENRQLSLI